MQGDFSRLILRMKALDRWENEGGRIYRGEPPMMGATSMDMQAGTDNPTRNANVRRRTETKRKIERGVDG